MQVSLEHKQEFEFAECPSHKVREFIWPTGTAASAQLWPYAIITLIWSVIAF